LDDGINAGEQSDRVLVRWNVSGVDAPQAHTVVEPSNTAVLIETPADIEKLRKIDRVQSDDWRTRQRAAFETARLGGLQIVGLNQDFSYVLDVRDETHETDGVL
jgi:predicted GNAT superfamily acetyltransferase